MQIPQFTEQHAELLSAFLSTQPGAMSLTQSQGYLFGIICSPEPLEVHQWLENILPNTANDLDEDMLFLFMALHHQVSEQVFELGYKLPAKFEREFCQQWSTGFLTASQSYTHTLLSSEQLEVQYKQALESAQATLSFFALDKPTITQIAEQNNIDESHLCEQQYELMGDFALGFAELIEIVALNSGLYTDEGWDE